MKAKAYSTKALPAGTILREWRLEEVLGVGGFGIVYKGRGIYFDELVAIKEYFPSAISERDEEETVVPIDSDAEEVHALGLKKFVEEAKLLWNLSTPSRHPNIVSVRSLFEVHGTAYMVMDFEDGVPLSKLLKKPEQFDEDRLREMILPVATGLERAHRVGVLHRDIKPSNILVTEGGRPVLIDFGSARFDTEGVTSTTVTFHTPPYAAIEQYVKTYEQGPWTDIYALGIVLYRCITGEKPAEVLERLHGEQEAPLIDGDWPGFSREFLAAVDAAMIIKPSDRPQSLPEWLAMFDGADESGPADSEDEDDEATRTVSLAGSVEEITPVNLNGEELAVPADTGEEAGAEAVPDDIEDAEFRMVGDAEGSDGLTDAAPFADEPKPEKAPKGAEKATLPKKEEKPKAKPKSEATGTRKGPNAGSITKPMILIGAALIGLAVLAWLLTRGESEPTPIEESPEVIEDISYDDGFGPALQQLVELANDRGIAPEAVSALEARAERIAGLESENVAISGDPSRASDVSFNRLRIAELTRASLNELAVGLSQDLTARTRRLVAAAPWADPRQEGSASGESAELQQHAATLEEGLRTARQSIESLREAESTEDAVPLAQRAILATAAYKSAVEEALADNPVRPAPTAQPSVEPTEAASPTATPTAMETFSSRGLPQITADLDGIAARADQQADEVIRLGQVRDPGRDASEEKREAFQTLQKNTEAARGYKSYLDTLTRSMRGVTNPVEAERLLLQGRQTQRYVSSMIPSSRASRAILDR